MALPPALPSPSRWNFPSPSRSAQSGFGIYGFLGLFAMHYTRDEDGITSLTPALTWLKDRAAGDPTNLQAWKPEIDRWAFGVGSDSGHHGLADHLQRQGHVAAGAARPAHPAGGQGQPARRVAGTAKADAEGTFLCVIDLDFGRGTLIIGLSIDFSINPIVEIKIPSRPTSTPRRRRLARLSRHFPRQRQLRPAPPDARTDPHRDTRGLRRLGLRHDVGPRHPQLPALGQLAPGPARGQRARRWRWGSRSRSSGATPRSTSICVSRPASTRSSASTRSMSAACSTCAAN